jgi:methylated-DNA-[protein]-cysteine S-methyltransferase
MESYHSYFLSPVGLLKISCTDEHLTTISFAEEAEAQGTVRENELSLQTAHQLKEYFAGTRRVFDLPIRQSGSPFQAKVWQLLHEIPFGKTISYSTLARQYGDLKATRAVAAANGKNQLAIICPCHRVIGSNQTLTGYAGGLWRKQWLLEHEAKYYAGVQQLEF